MYKNDRIDDTPATTTTYTLEVAGDELNETLYHVEIDKNGVTTRESKFYEEISLSINVPYKVYIVIGIYCDPEDQEVNRLDERVNQLVEERLDERVRWFEEQARNAITLLETRVRELREEIKRLERQTVKNLKLNVKSTREDIC